MSRSAHVPDSLNKAFAFHCEANKSMEYIDAQQITVNKKSGMGLHYLLFPYTQ